MLFNSYTFIFFFLPIVLLVFYKLKHKTLSIYWLILSSFFFYAWWNTIYLMLLIGSIVFNYYLSKILHYYTHNNGRHCYQTFFMFFGIFSNLFLLGYFKYYNFFTNNINIVFDCKFRNHEIILPLAISFYTFQQIAFLVDSCKEESTKCSFKYYCLFISFFPQLIAGPIMRYFETVPQYQKKNFFAFNYSNVSIGISIFIIGLFKKIVLADGIAPYATSVFNAANNGETIFFIESWCGSLSYTFQLYFDFSGYSDMAIGLGRMFNIIFPVNFYSPYCTTNIIDFWKQWHITLSSFLRDYIYIPLGGNRKGNLKKYINIMLTMLIGGLWHGAGWTFIVWGGIHGIYICLNHLWRSSGITNNKYILKYISIYNFISFLITFLALNIAWIFFRSENILTAKEIMFGLLGINGINLPPGYLNFFGSYSEMLLNYGILFQSDILPSYINIIAWLVILTCITWMGPNTYEIFQYYKPALRLTFNKTFYHLPIRWTPSLLWGMIISCIFTICIILLSSASEFLYFNF